MPQIAQLAATYSSQIFWMLLVFLLIYFGIGRGMLPRIQATVDSREARIAGDLAAAETARHSAEATEADYRARMDAARADAATATASAKAEALRDAEARVHAADADLVMRTDTAQVTLRGQQADAVAQVEAAAADVARALVAQVAGLSVEHDAAAAAVRSVLGGVRA